MSTKNPMDEAFKKRFHRSERARQLSAAERIVADPEWESPLSARSREEVREALLEAVRALSPDLQKIVVLYLDGKTSREISRLLGVPQRTAARRLLQAMDVISERIREEGFL